MIRVITEEQIQAKQARYEMVTPPQGDRFLFLEASSLSSYDLIHLPRAIHYGGIGSFAADRGQELIVYGEGPEDERPWQALEELSADGYLNLYYYAGGKADWIAAGLSTEATYIPPSTDQVSRARPAPAQVYRAEREDKTRDWGFPRKAA